MHWFTISNNRQFSIRFWEKFPKMYYLFSVRKYKFRCRSIFKFFYCNKFVFFFLFGFRSSISNFACDGIPHTCAESKFRTMNRLCEYDTEKITCHIGLSRNAQWTKWKFIAPSSTRDLKLEQTIRLKCKRALVFHYIVAAPFNITASSIICYLFHIDSYWETFYLTSINNPEGVNKNKKFK